MEKDYAVWNIDRLLQSYKYVPDMAITAENKMKALFIFMEKNGLLTCRVTDEDGHVAKRIIMASERTREGELISKGAKSPVNRWLNSKGSNKTPPDMKMLEKALAEIRGATK